MVVNVGSVDRVIRMLLGVIMIAMVFVGPQTPWGWLGVLFVISAFARFCPIYAIFNLSTNKQGASER